MKNIDYGFTKYLNERGMICANKLLKYILRTDEKRGCSTFGQNGLRKEAVS